MSDVEQTYAAGTTQGQGALSGLTGLAAGTNNKPIGIVAPQKRVVAAANTATAGAIRRANGAASIPAPVSHGQVNGVAQQPLNQARAAARPTAQQSGNRARTPLLEKRKLIQQQLLLFLHAHNCQRRENQANGEQWQPCTLPHCRTMKNVLNHMSTCTAGKNCTVPHCSSTRQIVGHWNHCVRTDCPVCFPLKQAETNWHTNSNAAVADADDFWLRLYIRLFGNGKAAVTQANPASQQTAAAAEVVAANPRQQQQNETAGAVAAGRSASNIIRLPVSRPTARTERVLPRTAASLQRNKEWQQSITTEVRNHIVHKFVRVIFCNPDQSNPTFNRILHKFVSLIKKVENEMYQVADSRSEYYRMIARKIYDIQKVFEDKRRQRSQRQQIQGQVQARASPDTANPFVPLKRSKPLWKSARAIPKPIGTVRPTLRMFIRVHSGGMRVLQNRPGTRQNSNGQTAPSSARSSVQANPTTVCALRAAESLASNVTVVPVATFHQQHGTLPASGAVPSPNPSEIGRQASASTSNMPPVLLVAPVPQENWQDGRRFAVERCTQSLVHANQCKEASCRLTSCQRMKRIVQHIKTYRIHSSGGCLICKQLVALCCHHARHCQEAKCPVPFCFNIKQKLKQQQQHRRALVNLPIAHTLFRPKSAAIRSRSLRSMHTRSQGPE